MILYPDEPVGLTGVGVFSAVPRHHNPECLGGLRQVVVVMLGAVLAHIELPGRVGGCQARGVQRTLHKLVGPLGLAVEYYLVVDLSIADLCVGVDGVGIGKGQTLASESLLGPLDQVEPFDRGVAEHRLPREEIEVQPILHKLQIQIFQNLQKHVFLSPHLILVSPEEQKLRDGDSGEQLIVFCR